MFLMSKGLSPIIATMLLVGIAISIGAIASIWLNSQSTEYMNKESERRERLLDKEGESLVLVHVEFDDSTGDLTLMMQNNGTSDLEVAYIMVNNNYFRQHIFCTTPANCELNYNESQEFAIQSADLPASINTVDDIRFIEVGTILGNLFIFNAPSPQIRVTGTFFEYDNILYIFSAEGSVDDGRIVEWIWCFDYSTTSGDLCECRLGETCVAGDCDAYQECDCEVRACGHGSVASYNYKDYDPVSYPNGAVVRLVVIDDTGMVGMITITVDIDVT